MQLTLTLLDHTIPLMMTLMLLFIGVALRIGIPYCRYVSMVAEAKDVQGRERLAKYLAGQTGGKKVDVSTTWRSFIPAARALNEQHQSNIHCNRQYP